MIAVTFAGAWLAHLLVLYAVDADFMLCEHGLAGLSQPGLTCCKAGRATRAWSERFFPASCPDGEVYCQGFSAYAWVARNPYFPQSRSQKLPGTSLAEPPPQPA
jgi:hypothetical protein